MTNYVGTVHFVNCKISKSLYLLNSAKNILSRYHLTMLYYALILSYLTYGLILWAHN